MNSEVGFAIVGTGNIAEVHAQAIASVEQASLKAVFSQSREKSNAFADKHGVSAESSLESLLARKDVNVVCIATPSGNHAEIAIPSFQAGKHVLCEKPLDIQLDRIDRMISEARKNQCILAGIFQSRFGQGAHTLKKAITEGRFGKLTLCDAYIKWWRSHEYYTSGAWRGTWALDGGGALMNQGIHAIDLLIWLAGMPQEVSAKVGTLVHPQIEVEDTAAAALRFPSGALGVIVGATSTWPGFSKRVEISGERGSAILEDDRLIFWKFETETPEDDAIRKGHQKSSIGGGASDPKAISSEGHRRHVLDLVDCIQNGKMPAISGEEGRKAVQLVLGIYESAKTGKSVSFS